LNQSFYIRARRTLLHAIEAFAREREEQEAAGGRFVESAVMSAVPPRGLASPMLLGGCHAEDFMPTARALKLDARPFSTEIGRASAVKMSRSVMIKGMEALVSECLLTARHYGVEREVLDSLSDTMPLEDWDKFARYMLSRSLLHGKRRAEEMQEAARTVAEAGVAPVMSEGIVERQLANAALGRAPGVDPKGLLGALLDAMLAAGEAPGAGEASDEKVPGSAA